MRDHTGSATRWLGGVLGAGCIVLASLVPAWGERPDAAKEAVDALMADQEPLVLYSYRGGTAEEVSEREADVIRAGAAAVPHLLRALDSGMVSGDTAIRAVRSLGYIRADAREALPALRKMAETVRGGLAAELAFALARIDGNRPEVRAWLRERARGGDSPALLALSEVSEATAEAVEVATDWIVKGLDEGTFSARSEARRGVEAVLQMRRGSSRLTAALVRGLREASDEIYGRALVDTGADVPNDTLIELLRADGKGTRIGAMFFVHRARRADPRVVEAILPSAEHAEPDLRVMSLVALGELRAKKGIPAALKALDDPEGRVRRMAATALGFIGERAPEVVAALTRHIADPEREVRTEVTLALKKLEVTKKDE